jgi:hypothetical protein
MALTAGSPPLLWMAGKQYPFTGTRTDWGLGNGYAVVLGGPGSQSAYTGAVTKMYMYSANTTSGSIKLFVINKSNNTYRSTQDVSIVNGMNILDVNLTISSGDWIGYWTISGNDKISTYPAGPTSATYYGFVSTPVVGNDASGAYANIWLDEAYFGLGAYGN